MAAARPLENSHDTTARAADGPPRAGLMRRVPSSRKRRAGARLQMPMRLQPWLLAPVFSPVECVLEAIERDGTLTIAGTDLPVCAVPDHQQTYAVVPALRCIAELFDLARVRDAKCPSTAALHRLASRLEANQLLAPEDLAACRACVAQLRVYAGRLTLAQLHDVVPTASIKFELDQQEG